MRDSTKTETGIDGIKVFFIFNKNFVVVIYKTDGTIIFTSFFQHILLLRNDYFSSI